MKRLYWNDGEKVRVVQRPSLPNIAEWDHGPRFRMEDCETAHIAWAKNEIPVRSTWHQGAGCPYTSEVLFTMQPGDRFEYVT